MPPNQRAVLILRDLLDCPAAETAELLDTSVASVTSALPRARATMQRYGPTATPNEPTAQEQALLWRYMDAHLRAWGDTEFRALSLDVLRIVDGRLAEITTFEPALFPAFGLPEIRRETD